MSSSRGIFLTRGSNWGLSHCRWIFYHLNSFFLYPVLSYSLKWCEQSGGEENPLSLPMLGVHTTLPTGAKGYSLPSVSTVIPHCQHESRVLPHFLHKAHSKCSILTFEIPTDSFQEEYASSDHTACGGFFVYLVISFHFSSVQEHTSLMRKRTPSASVVLPIACLAQDLSQSRPNNIWWMNDVNGRRKACPKRNHS